MCYVLVCAHCVCAHSSIHIAVTHTVFWLPVHTLFSITSLSFVSHFIISPVHIWRERAKTCLYVHLILVVAMSVQTTRSWVFFGILAFLSQRHLFNQINTKTIGNRKKRLCVRLRSGDKHHLRKSSDQKAQIRKTFVPLTGLICAFRSEDFLRWCLAPERLATERTISFFSISSSFWYKSTK